MQRLIVLSCVLAGTDLPSADRSVNFLDSNALMRAPTMRSAKLGRRSANREVPWTLEAPIAPRCKILDEHHQSASKASVSINPSIDQLPTSDSVLTKQLPAVTRSQHLQRPNPQGTAVTASRSHSPIKRIEPHCPAHRPHIVPPADRIASRSEPYRIPVPCNRKHPFLILPLFAPIIISKRTALRSINPLPRNPRRLSANRRLFASNIRNFRLFP